MDLHRNSLQPNILSADEGGVRLDLECFIKPFDSYPTVILMHNLDKITQNRFYIMALPYKVQGLDSSFCRAIVIQEK